MMTTTICALPLRARAARIAAAALLGGGIGIAAHAQPATRVAALAAESASTPAPAPTPTPDVTPALPSDSVYRLAAALTDQNGRTFRLDERRGRPMLVTMFYTSCQAVCPMLIESIRDVERQLSPAEREHVGVLLVSIDPEHDTVAVLKRTSEHRAGDPARWTLARTDGASVRKLAAVLGIQYRARGNGEFNHTTAIVLLDPQGRIVARSSKLGSAEAAFVQRVRGAARAAPSGV